MTDAPQNSSLQDKARDQLGAAKDAASQALATTKETAQHAFGTSRDAARQVTDAGNALGILIGGLAVGVIAGALLPKSERERELLAPVGKRINTTAVAAFDAAKETAEAEFTQRGLTRDGAQDQLRSLLDGVTKALTSAGGAAVEAARTKATAPTA